jgi:HEAT repeat protein
MRALRLWLQRLLDLRHDEFPRFSLLFLVAALFYAGVTWSTGALTAIILTEFGMRYFAVAFILFGITTIITAILYTMFVDRVPETVLLQWMTGIGAVVGLIGYIGLLIGARPLAVLLLFALAETVVLVWAIHWKTTVTTFYNTRASKRILPLLGAGQGMGIVAGGLLYWLLTTWFSFLPDHMLALWILTLIVATGVLWRMPKLLRDPKPVWNRIDESRLESVRSGFNYIAQSSYLRWLAASIGVMTALVMIYQFEVGETVLTLFQQTAPNDTTAQARSIGAFFALMDAFGALIMIPVQVAIFPRLMARLGTANTNLVYPVLAFVVSLLFMPVLLSLTSPVVTLFIAAIAHLTRTSLRRVFRSTVNALLYNAVPTYMKGRARSVTNGIIAQFAVIFIGIAGLIPFRSVHAAVLFLVAGSYAVCAYVLRRKYTAALLRLMEREDYAALLAEHHDTGKPDTDTLRMMEKQLQESDNYDFQQFLIQIMASVGGAEAIPGLLNFARTADEDMKVAVIYALIEADAITPEARTFFVNYVSDTDPFLRRAALTGMLKAAERDSDAALKLAFDFLHDPDHVLRAQMVTTVIRHGNPQQRDRARRVLGAMLHSTDDETRAEGIGVLAALDDPQNIRDLVKFLDDSEDEIRLAAMIAIEKLWREGMSPELVNLILERESMLLDDPVERVKQAEMMVLRRIGNATACTALVRALDDTSPLIRQTAQTALLEIGNAAEEPLRAAALDSNKSLARRATVTLAHLKPERYQADVLTIAREQLDAVYANFGNISALEDCRVYPTFAILHSYFIEQNASMMDELFDLLGVVHGGKAMHTIYDTIRSDQRRVRENAIETLEALAGTELARRIAPLFDPKNTPQRLATEMALRTAEEVVRDLIIHGTTWLRAVTVVALGEMSAQYGEVKRLILEDPKIPLKPLNACQRSLDPQVVSVLLRGAFASHEADVRIAAQAALRLIRGINVLESKQQLQTEDTNVLATIERMIYLKRIVFFQSLSVEQLSALANICEERVFKKDEVLFRQHQPGGILFIVISGAVDVGLQRDEKAEFVRLATFGANTVFGEMSLFDNGTRSADAIAREETLTLTLRREPFLALTRQYPDMSVQLITALSQRLRVANSNIAELRSTVRERMPDI